MSAGPFEGSVLHPSLGECQQQLVKGTVCFRAHCRCHCRMLLLPLPTAVAATADCCCCCPLLPHLPQGLLKYDYSTRDVTLLATHVSSGSRIDPGSPITYANDLAIARDGSIYFTSCTGVTPQE